MATDWPTDRSIDRPHTHTNTTLRRSTVSRNDTFPFSLFCRIIFVYFFIQKQNKKLSTSTWTKNNSRLDNNDYLRGRQRDSGFIFIIIFIISSKFFFLKLFWASHKIASRFSHNTPHKVKTIFLIFTARFLHGRTAVLFGSVAMKWN